MPDASPRNDTSDSPPSVSGPTDATAEQDDASAEAFAPNWMAIRVLLGLIALVVVVSLWIGDYSNAALLGAIGAGAGCMARSRLLDLRGDALANRWKLASYVFYSIPVGYAAYVFLLT